MGRPCIPSGWIHPISIFVSRNFHPPGHNQHAVGVACAGFGVEGGEPSNGLAEETETSQQKRPLARHTAGSIPVVSCFVLFRSHRQDARGGEGTPLTPFTSHLFLRICMDLCWWLTAVAWLHGPVHPQFMLEQTLVSDLPCAKSEARCKHEG